MEISVLSKHQCGLGEGAYWHALEKKLYWVDIKAHQIHAYDPSMNRFYFWQLPGLISVVCGMDSGNLIVGFEDKIAEYDKQHDVLKVLFDTRSGMRMNDGAVDPAGRFWIGQVDDSRCGLGKLYRYDSDGQCQVMEEGLYTSNGLDWDLNRKCFYLIDSRVQTIYVYDYEHETGQIKNRRVFLKTQVNGGSPDGMILDSEGYLWVCFWNGAKIIRYSPEGIMERTLNMPVSRPTKCVFGGGGLQQLFVTSAASNVNQTEQLDSPNGYVFMSNVGVTGMSSTLFGGRNV